MGFVFQAETNDTRYAPSINLITDLLNNGATVLSYDPVASLYNIIPKSKNTRNVKNHSLQLKIRTLLLYAQNGRNSGPLI